MKVKSCPTPSDPVDCSLPGFSVHGIFQARVLEWGAIAFSMDTVWKSLIREDGVWEEAFFRERALVYRLSEET